MNDVADVIECSVGVSKLRPAKPFHPAREAILSMIKK